MILLLPLLASSDCRALFIAKLNVSATISFTSLFHSLSLLVLIPRHYNCLTVDSLNTILWHSQFSLSFSFVHSLICLKWWWSFLYISLHLLPLSLLGTCTARFLFSAHLTPPISSKLLFLFIRSCLWVDHWRRKRDGTMFISGVFCRRRLVVF